MTKETSVSVSTETLRQFDIELKRLWAENDSLRGMLEKIVYLRFSIYDELPDVLLEAEELLRGLNTDA